MVEFWVFGSLLYTGMKNYKMAARSVGEEAATAVLFFGSYTLTREFAAWEHKPALAPVA